MFPLCHVCWQGCRKCFTFFLSLMVLQMRSKLSRQSKSKQQEDTGKTGQATHCLPCRACLSPSITAGTLGSEGLAGLDHHPPPSLPGFKLSLQGGTKKKASLGRDTLTLLTTGLDGPVDQGLNYCPHQRSSSDPGEKFKCNAARHKCSFYQQVTVLCAKCRTNKGESDFMKGW